MTTTEPGFYSIEKLLSQSVQPFPDLPADEFEILKQSIRDRNILNPVLLTSDGYLFDGHQRLKALIALGRKRISADQVKILPNVNRDNMLAHAYASNLVRRQVTTAEKAACMHQLVAKGWSQRKIAKEFAMSQPAVSKLMVAYPLQGDAPEVIITQGEDGKTYPRIPRDASPKPKRWAWAGEAGRAIRKARKLIVTELPTGLEEWEKAALTEECEALYEAIPEFLQKLESM